MTQKYLIPLRCLRHREDTTETETDDIVCTGRKSRPGTKTAPRLFITVVDACAIKSALERLPRYWPTTVDSWKRRKRCFLTMALKLGHGNNRFRIVRAKSILLNHYCVAIFGEYLQNVARKQSDSIEYWHKGKDITWG